MKQKLSGGRAFVLEFGYWTFALLFWETWLHFSVFGEFSGKFGYAVGFTVSIAFGLALALSFLNQKAAFWTNLLLTAALVFLYGSQMVYHFIFGTLYSVALIGQGGQAVTSFWRETLSTMLEQLPWLIALLAPLPALVILRKQFGKTGWGWRALALTGAALVFLSMERMVYRNGTELFSLKCYPRSGLGFKYRLQLNNTVGIIDSDYYNSDN